MSIHRGGVLMARFPHFKGGRGKKRPVVAIQADRYNTIVHSVLVAEVTKNLTLAADPAFLPIDIATPEGQATGLKTNSLISCVHLATLDPILIDRVIGKLSDALKTKLNDCLKAGMDLP